MFWREERGTNSAHFFGGKMSGTINSTQPRGRCFGGKSARQTDDEILQPPNFWRVEVEGADGDTLLHDEILRRKTDIIH